jgi:YggT family protein
MRTLFIIIDIVLEIYIWILFAVVVLSLMISFRMVDADKPSVAHTENVLRKITAPAVTPVRMILPNFGSSPEIAPVVSILIIVAIRYLIALYIIPVV